MLVRMYHINCLCTCPDLYKNNVVQGGRRSLAGGLELVPIGNDSATLSSDGGVATQDDEDDDGYYTVAFEEFPPAPGGPQDNMIL